ncbi:MAG: hypothetical protein AABX05_03775 [Nanoarchaeota archaeon]
MTDNYRKQAEVLADGPFPLERILTVSARDYCESAGKKLSDYEMIGVHGTAFLDCGKYSQLDFTNKIPRDTEVIVDYKFLPVGSNHTLSVSGTALIPK